MACRQCRARESKCDDTRPRVSFRLTKKLRRDCWVEKDLVTRIERGLLLSVNGRSGQVNYGPYRDVNKNYITTNLHMLPPDRAVDDLSDSALQIPF